MTIRFFIALVLSVFTVMHGYAFADGGSCSTAKRIVRPYGIGDKIHDGWLLAATNCLQNGIYSYTLAGPGGARAEAQIIFHKSEGDYRPYADDYSVSVYTNATNDEEEVQDTLARVFQEKAGAWVRKWRTLEIIVPVILIGLFLYSAFSIFSLFRMSRSATSPVSINIRLAGTTLLMTACAIELFFRATGLTPADSGMMRFLDEARGSGGAVAMPGASSGYGNSKLNNWGFNDYDFIPPSENDETFRIACVGDSFTFGWGVDFKDIFSQQLEVTFEQNQNAPEVDALNFGAISNDTVGEAWTLLSDANGMRPDLVIWTFVLNDVGGGECQGYDGINLELNELDQILSRNSLFGLRWHLRSYHYFISRLENHTLSQRTLDCYRDSFDETANTDSLRNAGEAISTITKYYGKHGSKVVFMIFPLLVNTDGNYPFENAHKTMAKIAGSAGADVLDLLPVFSGQHPEDLWVSPLNHHPNGKANAIAARASAEYLLQNRDSFFPDDKNRWSALPGVSIEDKQKIIGEALDLSGAGMTKEALVTLAPFIASHPDDADAQYAASEILIMANSIASVVPKIERLKQLPPPWSDRALELANKAAGRTAPPAE